MARENVKRIQLKCISNALNYVGFKEGKPHRVKKGDTFFVRTKDGVVPAKWDGLVQKVGEDGGGKPAAKTGDEPKTAVTNPAQGAKQQPAAAPAKADAK